MSENAIAKTQAPNSIKSWLTHDGFKNQIARALPRHLTADRMMRTALTALSRSPKLAECTHDSFCNCMLQLSHWGLEPDGRSAHLIPFKNNKNNTVECQLILDYKGLVQLVRRSGEVSSIHADNVFAGDLFEWNAGVVEKHVPWWLRGGKHEQGPHIATYVVVKMENGGVQCELMRKADIDLIRSRSKAKSDGPWVTDYFEMAKKTAFRRATKWLPVSAEAVEAFDRDFDRNDTVFDGTVSAITSVEAEPAQPGLKNLAAERKSKAANKKTEPEPDATESTERTESESEPDFNEDLTTADDGEITVETVYQMIARCRTPRDVDKLFNEYCGPRGPFTDDERGGLEAACTMQKSSLKSGFRKQAEAFDKGSEQPE